MSWNLRIDKSNEEDITSSEQLKNKLFSYNSQFKERPTLVQLVAPDGSVLSIGVGAEKSLLNYIPSTGWPACTSISDLCENEDGIIQFYIWDEITELQTRHCITFEEAVSVALHFYETEELSDLIEWEDD